MKEQMTKRNALEHPGLGRRLCCITILGITLAIGFGIMIDVAVPDVLSDQLMVNPSYASGTVGSTASSFSSESSTDLVLLNDSSFSRESGWRVDFYRLNEHAPGFTKQPRDLGTQIDISNIAVTFSYDININLRDYEMVTVSLDMTALRGPVEVSLSLGVSSFYSQTSFEEYYDTDSLNLTTGGSGTILLELNTGALYSIWNPLWIAQSEVGIQIFPVSSKWYDWKDINMETALLLENITVTATSAVSLLPLIVDLQDTQGLSAYDPLGVLNLIDAPALNLTSVEFPDRWGIFLPWQSNDTIYVPAGNYSGAAGIYSYDYANITYSVLFEVNSNIGVQLGLRFEMIRVVLSVSPDVPYLQIIFSYSDRFWAYSSLELAPPFPSTICIPMRPKTLDITIITPYRVENVYHISSHVIRIEATQSLNIDIHLRIALFSFIGILLSGGEILLIFLGLALLLSIILSVQKPSSKKHWKQIIRDPRFWPVLFIGVSALVPWFTTSTTLDYYTSMSSDLVVVYRGLYTPFALGLDRTANSLATVIVSQNFMAEILSRIVLFWLPLKWAFGYVGSPHKWKFNSYYAICLIIPLFLGLMVFLYSQIYLELSLGYLLVLTAPVLWMFALLLYRGIKRRER